MKGGCFGLRGNGGQMSLSPFASLRVKKPHATTALENECASSIRGILLGLGDRMFLQTLLIFTFGY
jgi:hypothetical protein